MSLCWANREKLRTHDRLLVLTTLLLTPFIAGCAQIKLFSVAPSTVCPGETVQIDWKASDRVMLNAVPSVEGVGEGPPEGSRSFMPTENTRFILNVPGLLKSAQREWDVTVIPSQSSRLLGGVAQCGGNPPFASASFSIQQKDSSSRVRAVSVGNNYHRHLVVSKDDIEVEIPPDGSTDGFKNASVIGTWTIRTPLGTNEACENVLDAIRNRLTIKTQMSCGE
ncbi:hypothetical protein [Nitrosovibrio tenuis]|uniref:Uncharacterized protein n=1 Tax=Nitrosovibrio tenuis TaxID=1233 RepID=A0A1H7J228_9PROT|nr:hypothetical protein [Nitrosovibrio tenuis]SEK68708.1 hypothetical protein SAMN05216387_102367 [Nitrosovibrio tenuis]